MPTVSVVTPTYNRADVLPETIDSVLNQTLDDFEYFVVDDGSTDDTEEVVRGYDDKRVTYVPLSGNQGANVARNRGIKEASGRYISFLDSDDQYLPSRLERTVNTLNRLSDDVCGVTHSFKSTIDGEVVRKYQTPSGRITSAELRTGNPVGGFSNMLFRANIFDDVGLLDERMPAYQDYEYYLRALQNKDFYGIDEYLCEKRKQSTDTTSTRISNNVQRKIDGQQLLLEKHKEKLSKRVQASFYYTRGRLYMRDSQISNGRRAFWKAVRTYPYHPLYYYNFFAALGGKRVFDLAQKFKRAVGKQLSKG